MRTLGVTLDIVVSSVCLPFQGEGTYRLVADLLFDAKPDGQCFLAFQDHQDSADCTGTLAPHTWFQAGSGWTHIDEELFVAPPTQALRVQLRLRRTSGQTLSQCRFDNIALFGPPQPTLEIPTTSEIGLGVLVGLLVLAGVVTLRRG